jgi:hypothetical protein
MDFALAFADDAYIPRIGSKITSLVTNMEKSLEAITKWHRQSGLVVNDTKSEPFTKRNKSLPKKCYLIQS